jgi:adenosylcobinamide kinase/adenosylcobinamide-phosphate guanylyltransferase
MLTLILGGARSGKSDLAQRMAAASGRDVVVIATMQPGDDEMRAKVAAHQASRPAGWRTVEEPIEVEREIAAAGSETCVVVDCATLWVTNLLLRRFDLESDAVADASAIIDEIVRASEALAARAAAHDGDVVIVSNEVGLGLVPAYPAGRAFRDALGAVNRIIAARADRVYFVVAGLAVEMKALGALPLDAFGEAPRQ